MDAIAAVTKGLLDERVFESKFGARVRFPELFQPSEAQEAERKASVAEVARVEAEAMRETLNRSDEEGAKEISEVKIGQDRALVDDGLSAPIQDVQHTSAEEW